MDVHTKDSRLCVLSEDGKLLKQRTRTEAGRFRESLGARPPSRIQIEDLVALELHR